MYYRLRTAAYPRLLSSGPSCSQHSVSLITPATTVQVSLLEMYAQRQQRLHVFWTKPRMRIGQLRTTNTPFSIKKNIAHKEETFVFRTDKQGLNLQLEWLEVGGSFAPSAFKLPDIFAQTPQLNKCRCPLSSSASCVNYSAAMNISVGQWFFYQQRNVASFNLYHFLIPCQFSMFIFVKTIFCSVTFALADCTSCPSTLSVALLSGFVPLTAVWIWGFDLTLL